MRRFEGVSGFHGLTLAPDGQRLAVAFAEAGLTGQHLYLMWADGSRLTPLAEPSAVQLEPAWSPDGRWLIYTAYQSFPATPDAPATPEFALGPALFSYLYAVDVTAALRDPASLQPRRLTDSGLDTAPAWRPAAP